MKKSAKAQRVEKRRNAKDSAASVNDRKWTKELMAAGWVAFPSVILDRQKALGLDAVDVNIILHLARYWWERDRLPFPSKATIAECMEISPSTVQRRIKQLEEQGLVKRIARFNPKHQGQQSNYYDISGLAATARPFALEALKGKRAKEQASAARRNRKLPEPAID